MFRFVTGFNEFVADYGWEDSDEELEDEDIDIEN